MNLTTAPYSSLRYNTSAARYVSTRGRFLSTSSVRDIIDADVDATKLRMIQHGAKLKEAAQQAKDGVISQEQYADSVKQWRNSMAADVKALHLGNAAAGVGGFANMTAQSHGAVGGLLGVQYRYLSNFAIEAVGNPDIVLSLDKSRRPFDERVAAYGEAGRGTFERLQHQAHANAGFRSMENVEDDGAIHCQGPNSCPEHTAMGRVAIDDPRYKMPGFRRCQTKCKCETRFFKVGVA